MTAETPAIRLDNVSKSFASFGSQKQRVDAVVDVSFDVGRGEVVALVGQSGSGKSTIARMLLALETISHGEILIEGRPVRHLRLTSQRREFYKHVQMIFQDPYASLNPAHTVRHLLQRPFRNYRRREGGFEAALVGLLESVGLRRSVLDRYPHQLSGGERQRVAIARALAVSPRVLVADEPTSMLDVSIRLEILNLLLDLRDKYGFTMIYITHDLASARFVADRILVMQRGRVVEAGPTEELLAHPAHPYTRRLLRAVPNPSARIDGVPTMTEPVAQDDEPPAMASRYARVHVSEDHWYLG